MWSPDLRFSDWALHKLLHVLWDVLCGIVWLCDGAAAPSTGVTLNQFRCWKSGFFWSALPKKWQQVATQPRFHLSLLQLHQHVCLRAYVCVKEREGGKSRGTLEGFGAFPSHEAVESSGEAPAEAGGAVLKISSHHLKFFFFVSSSSSFPYWWLRGEQVLSVRVIFSPYLLIFTGHIRLSHWRSDDGLHVDCTGLQPMHC